MRALMWEHFAPGGPIRVAGHHLADRFLREGAQVAWCAGPVSPVNFLKSNAESRARLRLWLRGGERLAGGSMFAYAPMTFVPYRPYPVFRTAAAHRLTLRATFPRLRRVLARAGFDRVDLLWMSPGSPFLALVHEVPHDLSVYRMSDDTAAFPDTPASFAALEGEICRRADLVVVAARHLLAQARELGAREILHLPNACDPEPFARAGEWEPADLAPWPRPRALYVGTIDSWFDASLLAGTARLLPRWTFVLLGPARHGLPAPLRGLPNVAHLGPRPHADLPAYMRHADAGIVPFRLDRLTHAIHPIKVYEYCAAGLAVVATPMRETAAMAAPLRLAADATAFAAALDEGLARPAGEREALIAFARRNTWDERFAVLQGAIATLSGCGRELRGAAWMAT